ncbi:putative transcription factor bHLH041 [Phragmites australis]|uniref:putative transcription factor bHLH041 n=1 Tax=Phragmites australis TaxID=29695 RepID=UPI002D79E2F1|nr:putative transcription factor bHLH041 [Phragmites australis]
MDGCSWLPFQDVGIGGGTASERSGQHHEQEEQDVVISSLVQQQLKQIHMLMNMNEHGHTAPAPVSSSSTFRSFSGSCDLNSSLLLTGDSTTATTSCHHPAEVSSLQIPLSPIAYGNLDTIPYLDDFVCQEAHLEQARRQIDHGGRGGAFRPYVRHLSPRKKPKPGSIGQRAIKAAMSTLARMHMARLAQWQCYQMEMVAAAPTESNCNQLQHVLSERKRREKLNDSFKALSIVLPPAPKKDKASILIRARDHINTLKSLVSELEEKNRMLVELQQHRSIGGEDADDSGEMIEVDICREAEEGPFERSQICHMKIVVRSGCNAMDVVVGTLQCLKQIGDVRLVAIDTGSGTGLPPGNSFQQATITLQLKSSRWDDNFLKESVIKTVKGMMQSEIETT